MIKTILILLITSHFSIASAVMCSQLVKKRGKSHIGSFIIDRESNNKPTFNQAREKVVINKAGTKALLSDVLSPYTAGSKSTTTSRLEERSVVPVEESRRILENEALDWVVRDNKPEGIDFTTVTAYAAKFLLRTDSKLETTAKIRMRKYYRHKEGNLRAEDMTPVFDGITALELKIKNVAEVTNTGFKLYKDSVFKPRFFIKDSTLAKLKKFTPDDYLDAKKVDDLILEIASLKNPKGKEMNNLNEVTSFVEALKFLRAVNPHLFEVKTVVAYNRDSFSGRPKTNPDLEFQYTIDRNIRIFDPLIEIGTNDLNLYLSKSPLTSVDNKYSFVELKAPVTEKQQNTPLYQDLIHTVESGHVEKFELGKGKHSLGSKARNRLNQESLSDQIYTEGLLFYLIKGTGNLPTPPNRKKLVEMGELNVAVPIYVQGKTYKVIFGYRANNLEGQRSQILESIRMTDHLGNKVGLGETNTKEIIRIALENGGVSTMPINGQNVSFPSIIGPKVVKEYNSFFSKFYESYSKSQANPREIENLHNIETKTQLERYTKRMIAQNKWNFFKDRVVKAATQQLIVGAAIVGLSVAVAKGNLSPGGRSEKPSAQSFIENRKNTIIEVHDGQSIIYIKARKEAPYEKHVATPILRENVEADIIVDSSKVRLERSAESTMEKPIFNITLVD